MSGKVWLTPLDAEGNPEGEAVKLEGEMRIEFGWEPSEVDMIQGERRIVRMTHAEFTEDGYRMFVVPCASVEQALLDMLGRKLIDLTSGSDADTILT